MRRTAWLGVLITAVVLAGCATQGVTETTVIGGSDGPTSVYLAPEADKEADKVPDTVEEESEDGAEKFLAGTWITASQGYEYYGTPQPEYYVRFEGTDIIYGHMKDGEFVSDHTNTACFIDQLPGGGYIVKAETENGDRYTYRSAQNDMDVLNYYEGWDESEFSKKYRAGASLSRSHDKNQTVR